MNDATRATERDTVMDVATRALAGFARSAKTGDFSGFVELLADDVEFRIPVGEPKRYDGRAATVAYLDIFKTADADLDYEPPFRTTRAGNTVVFEYEDHGRLKGAPYRNTIAISLDIRDGRIAAYREYWGEVDTSALKRLGVLEPGASR